MQRPSGYGLNAFSYVFNQPLDYVDPSGFVSWDVGNYDVSGGTTSFEDDLLVPGGGGGSGITPGLPQGSMGTEATAASGSGVSPDAGVGSLGSMGASAYNFARDSTNPVHRQPVKPRSATAPGSGAHAAAKAPSNPAQPGGLEPGRTVLNHLSPGRPPITPDEEWEAAKSGLRNLLVESFDVIPGVDMSDLKAPIPTDPRLLEHYEFMHDGVDALTMVLGVVNGETEARIATQAGKKVGEVLSRFGEYREKVARLARKAAEAEEALGVHGVSVTARSTGEGASRAARSAVEEHFPVHDTPTMADPFHRTVELPKPVTQQVADLFNDIFGRK
jgi:hypothetical protein